MEHQYSKKRIMWGKVISVARIAIRCYFKRLRVDMIYKYKQCFQTLFNKRAGREYGQFRKPCSDEDDPKDKVRNKLKHYNLMLSYCNPNGEQHQNLKKEKEKWLRVGQRMTNK